MNVPLLDLKAQYRTIKPQLDAAVERVIASQYFILGPELEAMEKALAAYLECRFTLGVSSGTDALLLALMACDIGPEAEVILPTYSFFATAGVVARLGARPVFTDIDPVTFNMDPHDLQRKITARTRAIIPVHLYGQSAALDTILAIAAQSGIPVVEDAAQAIGTRFSDGRRVGGIGQIGCFSFFPSKNLGCFGDGGLVTTNDEALYRKMKMLRVHGSEKKYIHIQVGANFRMDALQAAVVATKLEHLPGWSAKRRQNAATYCRLIIERGLAQATGAVEYNAANSILLPKAVYGNGHDDCHIYNQFVIRCQQRDALQKHLSANSIGSEIYYPVPFHRQPCFAALNYADDDFPVANATATDSLALPIFPELSSEQLTYVADTIARFFQAGVPE